MTCGAVCWGGEQSPYFLPHHKKVRLPKWNAFKSIFLQISSLFCMALHARLLSPAFASYEFQSVCTWKTHSTCLWYFKDFHPLFYITHFQKVNKMDLLTTIKLVNRWNLTSFFFLCNDEFTHSERHGEKTRITQASMRMCGHAWKMSSGVLCPWEVYRSMQMHHNSPTTDTLNHILQNDHTIQ